MPVAKLEVDRPLGAGEVLAAAFREYGRRPLVYIAIGAVEAFAGLANYSGTGIPTAVGLGIVAIAFVVCLAATAGVASGLSFAVAWQRARNAIVAIAGLAVIVGVPQTLGRVDIVFSLIAILWLAMASSAIPIVMLEQRSGNPVKLPGMVIALRRALSLAQLAFWHALGVVFALFVVTVLITSVLVNALDNFGDQSELAAFVISRAVLVPIVFIGLVVLYLDQSERLAQAGGQAVGERA